MRTLRELIDALEATDPEDVAAVHRVVSGAFVAGYRGFYREASAHSTAFAREWSAASSRGGICGGVASTNMRRRCVTCGKVCHPGAMGRHLACSAHSGWEDVR